MPSASRSTATPATAARRRSRRFTFATRTIAVGEVLDRWLAPDHRYVKVRGDAGCTYILRHEVETGAWDITAFSRG